MQKTEVKPEAGKLGHNDQVNCDAAEPYSETTSLGGPIPCMGYGPNPCRLQLSHKALKTAGMWPNDLVEVIAGEGEILVRKIGAPKPSAWETPRQPNPGIVDELMEITKEREARLKAAREGIPYDPYGEEGEEPLSDEQIDQEAL